MWNFMWKSADSYKNIRFSLFKLKVCQREYLRNTREVSEEVYFLPRIFNRSPKIPNRHQKIYKVMYISAKSKCL